MHLTVGIFNDIELAKKLAKAGTTNDIAIFNHASSEGVFTYVCPNSTKIQPLLQALNMIDVPVLAVKELTKEIGEVIIALDEMNFEKGFIVADDGVKSSLASFLKGTTLERFKYVSENELRTELMKTEIKRNTQDLVIPIDNYFNVKGIGTVILGIIRSGIIKKYDKVLIEPLGKEVMIKGIQSQDRDLETADAGMRVGLNLKGIETDEVRRGFVICKNMKKSSDFKIKLRKSKFFKQELKQGMQVCLSVGLQAMTCAIESMEGDTMKLKSVQPIAYMENQKFILASMGDALPRIIGSGNLA
jgi:selenocysteine-specific translation elongation factor